MNGYADRLLARTLGRATILRPRMPSRFEPEAVPAEASAMPSVAPFAVPELPVARPAPSPHIEERVEHHTVQTRTVEETIASHTKVEPGRPMPTPIAQVAPMLRRTPIVEERLHEAAPRVDRERVTISPGRVEPGETRVSDATPSPPPLRAEAQAPPQPAWSPPPAVPALQAPAAAGAPHPLLAPSARVGHSAATPLPPPPPRTTFTAAPRATPQTLMPEPTIHVTIGRVDVRAQIASESQQRRREPAGPLLTLADYLGQPGEKG